MSAEPRPSAQRPLEIHDRSPLEGAERRDSRGLRRHVGVNALGIDRDHGQADPVHGEAVAVRDPGRERSCSRIRKPRGVVFTSVISPTASISPVNITLDQHIVAQNCAGHLVQVLQGQDSTAHPRHPIRPAHAGCPKDLDAIDDRGIQQPACRGCPPLEHRRRPVPVRQPRRVTRTGCRRRILPTISTSAGRLQGLRS